MTSNLRALVLTVGCLCLLSRPVHAAGKYLQVEYPPSTASDQLQIGVTYTMWIPDEVARFRCVIVHQHGAGRNAAEHGGTAAYDLHWQALAKKWDCALLGPFYHVLTDATDASPGGSELWFDPRRGSDKAFLKALGELSAQAKHPELATVPWALWGHSGGGIWSDVMTTLYPDRVAAAFLRSGSFLNRPDFPQPETPAAAYAVPVMGNAGVKERDRNAWITTLARTREYRTKGGPAGFAPDPRTGHETGDSRYLAIPYFDAVLAMRLPAKDNSSQRLNAVDMSKGWLAPFLGDTAVAAASYTGNAREAAWLPNEHVAKIWMEYVQHGTVADATPPPPPLNVRVTSKGSGGNEVTWDAEADFESGIAGFFVMRDNKALVRLPATTDRVLVVYGRPLFQGLSYHDTPELPPAPPEMRYLDVSAKPGEKHIYSILSINSAGMPSAPSAEVSVPSAESARAADAYVPFDGEKITWHGFDRYDFIMDDATGEITSFKAPESEVASFGVDVTLKDGKRRAIVVVPKKAAPGNPWSWQACYWNHQPQTEVELLRRGFHIAFVAPDPREQGKAWDAWYTFLTEKHGLAQKAAFIGMSKGGVNEFNWGGVNPDKVAAIYADNPALYDEDFAKIPVLAKHDIPLLHVVGTEDFVLRYTMAVEKMYHQLGGAITVIMKEGHPHHPHSLEDPKPIADWIEQHMHPVEANRPAFADSTYTKTHYYSLESSYLYLTKEDTYATVRGPGYVPSYDRYTSPGTGNFHMDAMSIVVPQRPAPGRPWMFHPSFLEPDSTVALALLAKGYHIVLPPISGSGAVQAKWDEIYKLMVDNGFSRKVVLEGTGAKAGESYAWAIANPDKVSAIYARNPLLRSNMSRTPVIDNLAPLAKAAVPILLDVGSLDPWLKDHTRVMEKRYKALGGKITVLVTEGEGHFPLSRKDPKPVVDFILSHQR